jgi:hypothetical protein
MHLFATSSAEQVLELGKNAAAVELEILAPGRQRAATRQGANA